jgi:hypothetical protein
MKKNKKEEMQRTKGGGRLVLFLRNATLSLGLEKTSYLYLFFCFKCWSG